MIKNLLVVLISSLLLLGCVSKKKFLAQEDQFKNSQDSLEIILQTLDYQNDTLRLALSYQQGVNAALVGTQNRLQNRLDVLQKEIDRRGENASTREQMLLQEISTEKARKNILGTSLQAVQSVMSENKQQLTELEIALKPHIKDFEEAQLLIRKRTGQLLITINEETLFQATSTSKMKSQGKTFLENVGEVLLQYPAFQIQVVGHTDNKDNGRQSLDNWQYSALRAVSVVKHLTAYTDLGSNRVMAASKSEYAPLQSNETKEGRASNRRIELIIAPPLGFLEDQAMKLIEEALSN